jgi:hypothetical protein
VRVLEIPLYPPVWECIICGSGVNTRLGLPMYEGETVPADHAGEWADFHCCSACFDRWAAGETLMADEARP